MRGISEVARLAGVSKSTASRALSGHGYVSDATRERVLQAASSIGFVVSSNAASLVTGRTRNVGVVIPHINRWFFAEVLEGIERTLIASDYDLTLYRLSDDEEKRRRIFEYFLVRKRVDAVIAVGISLTRAEVTMLHKLGKPIVGVGGEIDGIATLSIDDVAAGRFVTEHLVSLGHTRIVHLGDDTDEQVDFHVHDRRLAGFWEALDAADLRHPDDFVKVEYSIPGGYEAALKLLADPDRRPTAIVAGCDEIAIGVITAARQLGIQVPSQLSVVGIDGHSLAPMFGLTTLEQEPSVQGELAVKTVLERLARDDADPADDRIVMPATLAVRTSTTAPPAA